MFEDMKMAVESLTGGKNTVIYDDRDMPSIMVVWPKQNNKNLISGGSDQTHYGSIVNNVEKTMYISKYQNIVVTDRAYSLPGQDPKTSVNFDEALKYCRNKGKNWGLMPFSLWAQVALWCRKNGTMPHGNNQFSHDVDHPLETAVTSLVDGTYGGGRCLTGTGPATWNHNWLPDGICDLNGNVWEWCAGMRVVDGEIQIIPNANVMDPEVSLSASSSAWKAIMPDGSLVDPGTSGTLHYDAVSGITLNTSVTTSSDGTGVGYTSMGLASGVTVPEIAKALILYPDEHSGDYGGDYRYLANKGERLPICGGDWGYGSSAGVFGVYLTYLRSSAAGGIGFRSAYCVL